MTNLQKFVFVICLVVIPFVQAETKKLVDQGLLLQAYKEKYNCKAYSQYYPRWSLSDDKYALSDHTRWTAGFYPGILILLSKIDREYWAKNRWCIESLTDRLFSQEYNVADVGMVLFPSLIELINLAPELAERYENNIDNGIASIKKRYNSQKNLVNHGEIGQFRARIDNMMNVPFLTGVYRINKDHKSLDLAVDIKNGLLNYLSRPNGSVWQEVRFKSDGGMELWNPQGLNSVSGTWSRGLGWKIYGLTNLYCTSAHDSISDEILSSLVYLEGTIPKSGVLPWDLEDKSEDALRDSSASALIYSSLTSLKRCGFKGTDLNFLIGRFMDDLFNPSIVSLNSDFVGILKNGTYNANNDCTYCTDSYLIWGDYFLLESLVRDLTE
jgi:unsaturated chondroitin disaccharide hydrolase